MSITPNDMPGAQAEAPVLKEPTPAAAAPEKATAAPWESEKDFKPDKAWELIQKLRAESAEARALVDVDVKSANKRLKQVEHEYNEFKAKAEPVLEEHERLRRASQTELDRAREDLNAIAEREQAWRNKAVTAEAKSLADQFIDSDAAIALVGDLSTCVTDDGVDVDAIAARFDELAAQKPHLLKPPPGFTPNRAQGQSGTGQIPIDAQINAAQERGDLITSIALKQHKRYAQ